jgi:hypothetical protein
VHRIWLARILFECSLGVIRAGKSCRLTSAHLNSSASVSKIQKKKSRDLDVNFDPRPESGFALSIGKTLDIYVHPPGLFDGTSLYTTS